MDIKFEKIPLKPARDGQEEQNWRHRNGDQRTVDTVKNKSMQNFQNEKWDGKVGG